MYPRKTNVSIGLGRRTLWIVSDVRQRGMVVAIGIWESFADSGQVMISRGTDARGSFAACESARMASSTSARNVARARADGAGNLDLSSLTSRAAAAVEQ